MNEFYKYYNLMLLMANTEAGRYLLGVKNNYPIVKLSPNSIHFEPERDVYLAHFYIDNKIEKILMPSITKMDIVDSEYKHIDNKYLAFLYYNDLGKYNYPQIYLYSNSFMSNPSGCDGNVWAGSAVFATVHDATSGNASLTSTTENNRVWHPSDYYIDRCFFSFITSSLGTNVNISSCDLNIYADSVGWSGGGMALVQSTQASGSTLVNADFNDLGNTEGCTRPTVTTSGQKTFSFNATGLSWISKTSYTMLAIRYANDIDNAYVTDGGVIWRMSEYTGTNPYLSMTYGDISQGGIGNRLRNLHLGNGMSRSEGAT